MTEPTKRSPPYIGFGAFTGFLNQLRDTSVPSRIDRSVLGNASGGMAYGILSSLKFLKLIDDRGAPTPAFKALVKAQDSERPEHLKIMLENGFTELFNSGIDLESASSGQFDEVLRSSYDIRGSTVDKVAIFFLGAAKQAGISVSHQLEKRKPVGSIGPKRLRLKRDVPQNENGTGQANPSQGEQPALPAQTQNDPVTTLVGIIDMAEMSDQEQEAVWILIRYLKKREAARKQIGGGS